MTSDPSHRPVSALRQRMIEDMSVRGFTEKTRGDYVRNVRAFAAFIRRSPDTATVEDLRRFRAPARTAARVVEGGTPSGLAVSRAEPSQPTHAAAAQPGLPCPGPNAPHRQT